MKPKINFILSIWWKNNKISAIALLVCLILFIFAYNFANSDYEKTTLQGAYTLYETATIESILSEDTYQEELYENNYVGTQTLLVKITSGDYKDSIMSATNYMSALYGTYLEAGDSIVAALSVNEGEVYNVAVYEFNRTIPTLIILGIFVLANVLIGGKKGAQSLLGLALTVVTLIWILVPLLIKGFPTLPTTLCVCIYVAIVCFILIGGIHKKSICAMLGTTGGLILATLFGLLSQAITRVNGMRMGDYVDALLQLKQGGTPLELSGLLIGGTMIASIGAIMDVAMSISSSMQELTIVNPSLTQKELWNSGMNIGRDMIGTMTNTLILAFVGSSFLLVIYIWTLHVPVYELLSSTLVATEFVHSIASSMGVILSVPLTVLICSISYSKKQS